MRYREFVIENSELDEEISLTQYEPVITKAVTDSIKDALIQFEKDYSVAQFHSDQREREAFNQGHTTKLTNIFRYHLKKRIDAMVIQTLEHTGMKIEPNLRVVEFSKSLGNARGVAKGGTDFPYIQLRSSLLDKLPELVYQHLHNKTMDGDFGGEGELLYAFWGAVKHTIKNWDSESANMGIPDLIYDMVDVFIHELVHIKQHVRQKNKGRNEIEFRSYLDKDKHEYRKLATKKWNNGDYKPDLLSPEEQERYYQLYQASPAEMSAFAHNIVLSIIKDSNSANTDDYTRAAYIKNAQEALREIPIYLDHISRKYKGSTDKRTQMVYKRYHKLVYQELYARLQQYIKSANFQS